MLTVRPQGERGSYVITNDDGTPVCIVNFLPSQPGVTIESVLDVCIRQLEVHQRGPQPCVENMIARNHLKDAIEVLKRRQDRMNAVK